jgi:multisubunit Na+/H+ antiporter MnhF subunit
MNDYQEMLQLFMIYVILPLLTIGMLLTLWRLVRGPTFADRVVALDKLSVMAIGLILAYGIGLDRPVYVDIALIVAMLSFLATVGFGYYIERRV